MSSQDHPDYYLGTRLNTLPLRTHRRLIRRLFFPTSVCLLLLLGLNLWSTLFSTPQAFASARPPVVLKGSPSKPNTLNTLVSSRCTMISESWQTTDDCTQYADVDESQLADLAANPGHQLSWQ